MGDFDNLAREMTRRERIHAEVRERADMPTLPTDYARIAVLQTEREHIRRELNALGNRTRAGSGPLIERYDAIDNEIRKALG